MRRLAPFSLVCMALALSWARARTPTEAAVELFDNGRYPEAAASLSRIVAADPGNAAACFYLGLSIERGPGGRNYEDARPWLGRAASLAPNNAEYVGEYGGACLHIAERDCSILCAIRGRDALKRVLVLNPDSLKARDGLMQFYARAPWPLGSSSRAFEQAGEIARRDRNLGVRAYLNLEGIFEDRGSRTDARKACRAAIELDPASADARSALGRLGTP